MKDVFKACNIAGIDPPEEVEDFFGGETPNEDEADFNLEDSDCCRKYENDMEEGFEIIVDKIPEDVTIIRFVNSW
jgi:hypothetical protein